MTAKTVLFVDNGNIHRSVIAEIIFNKLAAEKFSLENIRATSRGLQGSGNTKPPKFGNLTDYKTEYELSKQCLSELSIDIESYQSTPVNTLDIRNADLILVMDSACLETKDNSLFKQFPNDVLKMHLFNNLIGEHSDVPDCFGSEQPEQYREVIYHIHNVLNDKISVIWNHVKAENEITLGWGH